MRHFRALLLLLTFILLPRPLFAEDATDTAYLEGCAAYDAGRFAEAKEFFEGILSDSKKLSADLFYNLGCTEARLENSGRAALWFQRTLLLDPRHHEARQNLRFLAKKEAFLAFSADGLQHLASYARHSTWRSLFWTSLWIAGLSAVCLFWLRPRRALWVPISLLCIASLATGASGLGLYAKSHQLPPDKIQVAVEKGLTLYNAPAEAADEVISLNLGTQSHPLETRGQWSYVELPGEVATRGWIRTKNLEPLWPYANSLID